MLDGPTHRFFPLRSLERFASQIESELPDVFLASADDIPAMMEIERQSSTAAHWTNEQYRAIFESAAPRRLAWIVRDVEAVGFLVARAFDLDREWEIEHIAISNSSQRKGYGSRLLSELTTTASSEDATLIFLEVRDSNLKARAFYEKHLFREFGKRTGYYSGPSEDAILYRLLVP